MSKYTPWFLPGTKPARLGIYQRRMSHGTVFAMWNGNYWAVSGPNVSSASVECAKSYHQPKQDGYADRPWRGLKEPA